MWGELRKLPIFLFYCLGTMPVLDLLLPFSESALPAPINLSFFCANDEIVSISHATNSEVLDIGKFLIKSGYLQINLGVDLFPSF